jgi:hypothetical protein
LTRFKQIDHAPETVDLAALHDFQRLEASESIVRRLKPLADELDSYDAR